MPFNVLPLQFMLRLSSRIFDDLSDTALQRFADAAKKNPDLKEHYSRLLMWHKVREVFMGRCIDEENKCVKESAVDEYYAIADICKAVDAEITDEAIAKCVEEGKEEYKKMQIKTLLVDMADSITSGSPPETWIDAQEKIMLAQGQEFDRQMYEMVAKMQIARSGKTEVVGDKAVKEEAAESTEDANEKYTVI